MITFKPKFGKDIHDFLRKSLNCNVIIEWSEAISIDDFETNELSHEEDEIVNQCSVIYIFTGVDKKGDDAVDVGQTKRSLEVRTKEHLRAGDYLEGYSYDQEVYCGKVKSDILVDRDLLEQVEGIIIKTLEEKTKGTGINVCNDLKKKTHASKYSIGHIYNKNVPKELTKNLPSYIPEGD